MVERKTVGKKILKVSAVVLVVLLTAIISMLFVTKLVYDSIFPRYERNALQTAINIGYDEISEKYPRLKVSFMSGENKLSGYIYSRENKEGLVVVTPGLSDGAEDYTSIVTELVDAGFAVFAFDTTGSFESEGDSSVGFAQAALDLDSAIKYIKAQKEYRDLPLCLFGHSRGGYASALMPAFGHDIAAIVSVSGVNSCMEVTMESSVERVGFWAYTGYPGLFVYQSMLFGSELLNLTAADALEMGEAKTLIIQSENDDTVSTYGSSIYAHKDEIENPNVQYYLYTDESNQGHTALLYTEEANEYREKILTDYDLLSQKHNGDIPENEEQAFYSGIDSLLAQQVNKKLADKICLFFLENVRNL